MLEWVFAAFSAIVIGVLAYRWKTQSGIVWAVIALMLYFIVWSVCHLAGEIGIELGDTVIAVISGTVSVGLIAMSLFALLPPRSSQ